VKPGEHCTQDGDIEINVGRKTNMHTLANTCDRPLHVG
jgi:urease beta subunit